MHDEKTLEPADLKQTIKELLAGQSLGVLATQANGKPHGSLMAFAATADMKHLVFCTPRTTRKYANLSTESRAAMLIDNRSNQARDFHAAAAVTAVGRVEEIADDASSEWRELFLAKHPYMDEFLKAPTTALMRLVVETYSIVQRFQNVYIVKMS